MCSVANDLINKIIRLKTAILNTDLAVSTDCSFNNLMLYPNNILLKKRERESASNVHTVLPYPVGSMSSLPKGIQLKLPAVPSINVIPRKKKKDFHFLPQETDSRTATTECCPLENNFLMPELITTCSV